VCLWLCTASVHNTTQNSSDNLPFYLQTNIIDQEASATSLYEPKCWNSIHLKLSVEVMIYQSFKHNLPCTELILLTCSFAARLNSDHCDNYYNCSTVSTVTTYTHDVVQSLINMAKQLPLLRQAVRCCSATVHGYLCNVLSVALTSQWLPEKPSWQLQYITEMDKYWQTYDSYILHLKSDFSRNSSC